MSKRIKEGLNKWRDRPYSNTGRLRIIRKSNLTKAIYRLKADTKSYQVSWGKWLVDLKSIQKYKGPEIVKIILKKKVGCLFYHTSRLIIQQLKLRQCGIIARINKSVKQKSKRKCRKLK